MPNVLENGNGTESTERKSKMGKKNTKAFKVTGEFEVYLDDVLDFLEIDDEYREDYEPTDDEWLECARDLWESDECSWIISEVEEA